MTLEILFILAFILVLPSPTLLLAGAVSSEGERKRRLEGHKIKDPEQSLSGHSFYCLWKVSDCNNQLVFLTLSLGDGFSNDLDLNFRFDTRLSLTLMLNDRKHRNKSCLTALCQQVLLFLSQEEAAKRETTEMTFGNRARSGYRADGKHWGLGRNGGSGCLQIQVVAIPIPRHGQPVLLVTQTCSLNSQTIYVFHEYFQTYQSLV